jgi:predicted metalloprotease
LTVIELTVAVLATAALFVVAPGLGRATAGTPQAGVGIDTVLGGAPITFVDGRARRPDVAAAVVFADLERFWTGVLPTAFGVTFTPPRAGYTAVDASTGSAGAQCVPTAAYALGNAVYCPDSDGIVYDSGVLVPVLLDHYGVPGLAAALAHEYGHAIQARVGPTIKQRNDEPERYPTILIEAQADCYAGAYLADLVERPGRVRLTADSLLAAVDPLLDFRDLTTGPGATTAPSHGLGVDRLRFVLRGRQGGPTACAATTASDLHLADGRVPAAAQDDPRFAGPDAVQAAAVESLHANGFDGVVPAGEPGDVAAAGEYGQFALATATVLAAGRQETGDRTGAACYTGAWLAAVYGHAQPGRLGSWPGDADEALDLVRSRPGATFAEIVAFARGFDDGRTVCR